MSSGSGGAASFNQGITKDSFQNFLNAGNKMASRKGANVPGITKSNISFNDPNAQPLRGPDGSITRETGITNLINPSEVSNVSQNEIDKLIDIFRKRSENINLRRLAPGVTQTRLIGR
ncbi:MAG: hypothetical protein ACTSQA_01035 [Candidatus Heimdallarchaeaceae archaeon]